MNEKDSYQYFTFQSDDDDSPKDFTYKEKLDGELSPVSDLGQRRKFDASIESFQSDFHELCAVNKAIQEETQVGKGIDRLWGNIESLYAEFQQKSESIEESKSKLSSQASILDEEIARCQQVNSLLDDQVQQRHSQILTRMPYGSLA